MKRLGTLTQEQKEFIWKNKMSGSQIKRIFSDAKNLFLEKTGQKEVVDLSTTRAKKFIVAGNYMEEHIFNMAVNSFEELANAKIDKDTFEDENDSYLTANIDGYVGESIDDMDYIVEIKNTTCTSDFELLERYEAQIRYYSKLFNAKKGAFLIAFVNGNELKKIFIERDEVKEQEIFAAIEDFRQSVELGIEPAEVTSIDVEIKPEDIDAEHEDIIREFAELKQEEADIKARLNIVKNTINEKYDGQKAKFVNMDGWGIDKTSTNRVVIDKDGIIGYLAEKYNEDITKLKQQFSKVSETVVIKAVKPKGVK